MSNVHFDGITINSGRGDDGEADYVLHDLIVSDKGYELENVTGTNITVNASEFADVNLHFSEPATEDPADETADDDEQVTDDTEPDQAP